MEDTAHKEASTELALPTGSALELVFKDADVLHGMIDTLTKAVRDEAAGLSVETKKGRDALVSLAYRVSQSKTALDKEGKALTEKQRAEIAAVNAGRKVADDRLTALRDEVRKPVTEWEANEVRRVANHIDSLTIFNLDHVTSMDAPHMIADRLALVEEAEIDEKWEEYEGVAAGMRLKAIAKFTDDLRTANKRVADAVELEAARQELEDLRAEKAARQERDEKEAADKLAAAAEAAAQRLRNEAIERAEYQRRADVAAEEARRIEAEAAAEAQRIADLAAMEARRIEAQEAQEERDAQAQRDFDAAMELFEAQAKADLDAAVEAERLRAEGIAEAFRLEAARLEADTAHVAEVHAEILTALHEIILNGSAGTDLASEIQAAIVAGHIPHIKVTL
jgi:colicin import membrane protein